MENFEFKSAICTSVEQSKRLLKLGLKKKTADMYYPMEIEGGELPLIADSFFGPVMGSLPAWSLHRLMEIAYNGDILRCVALNFHERNIGAYYEQVIKVIEYLIKIKEFNKDYLEE